MIQPTNQEQAAFKSVADSPNADVIVGYLERVVVDTIDVRKITGTNMASEMKARKMFADMVEELKTKFKIKRYEDNKDEWN